MVKESRRDGTYSGYGFQSVGSDKRLMLTRANPVGMAYMVTIDFSPWVSPLVEPLTRANPVGMGHIVTMDFSPLVEHR